MVIWKTIDPLIDQYLESLGSFVSGFFVLWD